MLRYEESITALVISALALIFNQDFTTSVVELLTGLLVGGNARTFLLERYTPTLYQAYADNGVKIGLFAKCRLLFAFLGILVRFVSNGKLSFRF